MNLFSSIIKYIMTYRNRSTVFNTISINILEIVLSLVVALDPNLHLSLELCDGGD